MAFDAGAIVARLELNAKQWEQSISRVKADQSSLSGYILRNEQGFKNMGKALTVAGGAVVASFGVMIAKTANLGDELNDLSQRTGISTELLSSFKLAADKSGTSLEGFATGMKGLSRAMFDASTGGAEAQEAFAAIGVSATDSAGAIRPLDQVMLDVADRFKDMPDGAEKAALAMRLFGKSGIELIPMLNLGREGLEKEAEAAKKLGMVFSKESAKACDEFNDSLAELKGGMQGVGIQIGNALMPLVKGLVEKVTDITARVTAWAAEHPGLASGLGKVALGLGALGAAIGPVLIVLPSLIKGIQALKTLAATPIVFTIIIATPLIAKAVADFKGAMSNMKEAMKEAGASGFEATLEGINSGVRKVFLGMNDANLVLSEHNALAKLYAREGGQATKDILLEEAEAAETAGEKLGTLGDQTQKTGRIISDVLVPAVDEAHLALAQLGQSALDAMPKVQGLESVMDQIPGIIENTDWNQIPEKAEPAIDQTKTFFDGLWSDIAQGFGNTLQEWMSGATTFKDFMVGLWGDIKNAIFAAIGQEVTNKLMGLFDSVINKTKDVGDAITKNISSALGGTGQAAGSMASSFLSAASSIANVVTAVASVVNLLKKPPTGAADGMGRVVERQDQQTSMLTRIFEDITGNLKPTLWDISEKAGGALGKFDTANGWLKSIDATLKGLKGASSGAVSTQTELLVVHGTQGDPEITARASQLSGARPMPKGAYAGQGRAPSANITFNIRALDGADVVSATRRIIIPELQRFYGRGGRIPAAAIGG